MIQLTHTIYGDVVQNTPLSYLYHILNSAQFPNEEYLSYAIRLGIDESRRNRNFLKPPSRL